MLNDIVCKCRKCPRLVDFRESIEQKKAYHNEKYWKKPVPGYGSQDSEIFLIGLAPSAHGGNRTGRIFTGDLSGDFLMESLYLEKMASQPNSDYLADGLKLYNIYMSAAVKCVPPKNMPSKSEEVSCFPYLVSEFSLLKKVNRVLVLGKLAHGSYLRFLKEKNINVKGVKFIHGRHYEFENMPTLFCSYHPSPQNTNTGKLTQNNFRKLLKTVKNYC